MPLEGRTWAIAETIQPGDLEAVASPTPLPPTVVTQHARPPRRFVLLTTQGCYVITRLRPVDQLRLLLEASKGSSSSSDAVQSFFALHKVRALLAKCALSGPGCETLIVILGRRSRPAL